MLFDSHTHINNETFTEEERDKLIAEIEESVALAKAGLSYVMDVGCDLASSAMAAKHAEKYPWCYAAVGCHPHGTDNMDEMQLAMIKGLAKKEKVMAIGEIGLDFHYDFSQRENQRVWFRKQIRIANELKMPIIIHSREADEEVMKILKEEGAFSEERCSWFPKRMLRAIEPTENREKLIGYKGSCKEEEGKTETGKEYPDARVLLHCYSGNLELAEQYVKLGATLSVAGPLTYKGNKKTRRVVEGIPIDFLLVETDAPYLTPEPFRGKQNKSPYVEYTARKMAEIKGMTFEEVVKITCENAKFFFEIA